MATRTSGGSVATAITCFPHGGHPLTVVAVIGHDGGMPRRPLLTTRRAIDRTLIATQVALSLMLLIGAGLFLRTLSQLWAQDTGYDRRNVLMFSIDARLNGGQLRSGIDERP